MRGSGDYIEREAAREAVWQILNGMGYSEKHNDRLVEEVDAVFDEIPAADVRPVVLCRDCKYWNRERISCEGLARCNIGESGIRYRSQYDFCSRGVKREES